MYTPDHFAVIDQSEQLDLLERFPFGTLITVSGGRLRTSTIPFLVERTGPALFGHVARANSHWTEFAAASETLVSFIGPNAYISPSWYQNENLVPTWNYVAVEVRGQVHLLDEPAQRLELVDRLSAYHERHLPKPWHSEKLPPKQRDALLNAIVAFRVDIRSIEAKAKLSQNRDAADIRSAAAQLMATDGASNAAQLAEMMLEIFA